MDRLGLGDGKADGIAHRPLHRLSGNPCVLVLEKTAGEPLKAEWKAEWIIENGELIMGESGKL